MDRKPEHSVSYAQHSMSSTHVTLALLFLLPSKLEHGIARSLQIECIPSRWTQSTGTGPTHVVQALLFPAPKQTWAGKQKTLTAMLSGPVDCGERGIRTPGTVTRTAV